VWKEAILASFGLGYYSDIKLEGLRETTKTSLMTASLKAWLEPEKFRNTGCFLPNFEVRATPKIYEIFLRE
jgi:hypothetical protein